MELISYFFRFIYRIKWWLITVPLLITILFVFLTRNLPRSYEVKTTIYTGVMSGFNINEDGTVQNINVVNNTIDNIINVITAQSTLRRVSMRLFFQHMVHGDPNKDNNYILARNYNHLLSITPNEVKGLINKDNEEETLKRLFEYADSNTENFLYGLFNWAPPYYSYDALSKIKVQRLGNSDMLEISYSTDDPGITYHTLQLINDEFMKAYNDLQFGETDKIIRFFEEELSKTGKRLKISEDSLTEYNIQKRIINYDEQTKHLAALSRDFQLQLEEVFLQHNSSEALSRELERRIGEHARLLRNNNIFINKLQEISDISAKVAQYEAFQSDSTVQQKREFDFLKKQLKRKEDDFRTFSDSFNIWKNSKEGYPNADLVSQWLSETLRLEEAKAKLTVMEKWQNELSREYVYYSPIGSTIKRKEREIDFTEASYLEILHSLNTARLRQKSLQMTSATLKVLNPPTFPLTSAATKRKMKVITAFIASFIFIFGYFLFIEVLDRTLRSKIRAERITSGKVIGAFPGNSNILRHRGYTKRVSEIAARSLGNILLRYLRRDNELVVNLISIQKGEGKSFVAEQLAMYYSSLGLKVRNLSWNADFTPASENYLLAEKLDDIIAKNGAHVTFVEYPPLEEAPVPESLLQQSCINLLVVRATRGWRDVDNVLFKNLNEQTKNVPFYLILNKTRREETEYFTGLLPPYTRIRKFIYRISQLGFTSVD
jgi:uncharacterized protein involved in exopolysaccharide biosynthesis